MSFLSGGKEVIRTPEALLTLTRFPGGPLQPLEHLSEEVKNKRVALKFLHFYHPVSVCKDTTFFYSDNFLLKKIGRHISVPPLCKPKYTLVITSAT